MISCEEERGMLPLVALLLLPATEAAVPAAGPSEVAGVGGAGMAALLSIRMMGGYEDWTPPECGCVHCGCGKRGWMDSDRRVA